MLRRFPLGLALALFAFGAEASNYQTNILSFTPVSLWKFNEASGSISDVGSNAYTATVSGTGQTYGVAGLEGGASPPTAISTTSSGTFAVSTSGAYNATIDYNKQFLVEFLVNVPSGALPTSGNNYFPIYSASASTNWFLGVRNNAGNVVPYFSPTSASAGIGCAGANALSLGVAHHVVVNYTGSSGNFSCGDIIFYLDGVPSVGSAITGSTPGTGTWAAGTMATTIGAANNGTAVTVQDLAIYSTAHPSGSTTRLANSSNSPLDILASYHAFLYQNNNAALANPPANPPVMHEKDCSDSDDWATWQYLMDGQYRGLINVLSFAANARNVHCASAMKAFLHYWNKDNIPVGAYQGTSLNYQAVDDGFGNVETDFRPWDSTDKGITAWTIGAAGNGYNIGDVVQLGSACGGTNCGTLETHDTTQRQQWKVLTLTGGAGTGIATMREYYGATLTAMAALPSYSTAPDCTSACTLTTISGSGSGATLSAVTTTADRGNFPDAEWLWTDIIAANSGVYITNGGQSAIDFLLASNHASTVNSNVAGLVLMQCDMPSTAYWSVGLEYNCGLFYSDWTTIASNLTVPRIYVGVENTNAVAGGSVPQVAQGWIYGGYPNTTNKATIPGEDGMYNSSTSVANGFGGGSCPTHQALACYRTFWDMWIYWLEYGSNPSGSGKATWMLWAGGNNATMAYTASTNTFSATSGGKAYFLRRTQEAAINSDLVTIMAESPASFATPGGGLMMRGVGSLEPANDNDPRGLLRRLARR